MAAMVCSIAAWGVQFLLSAYQPSRPLYTLAWLALCGVAYIAFRRKNPCIGSVAGVLCIIFGAVFIATLFMRN